MLSILRDQTKSSVESVDIPHLIEFISSKMSDYDADKQKPMPGEYRKWEQDNTPAEGTWLTRLEDIDHTWLQQYVTNVIVGYKLNQGGMIDMRVKTRAATIFTDSDGEPLTDAYLMTDFDNTTGKDLFEAKAKLPYLLKRLHFKSKQLGTSLISMYGVYLRILQTGKEPKPRDMLKYKIYRMDSLGHVTTPYPESANHNKGFPEAFAFVRGQDQDEYYNDLLEFGRVLDFLGVKLWQEDPAEFDESFISKLIVTYVVYNKDFLWRGQKKDSNILNALSNVSRADWGQVVIGGDDSNVRGFVSRIGDSSNYQLRNLLNKEGNKQIMNAFFRIYSVVTKDRNFLVDAETYMSANRQADYTEEPQVPTYDCLVYYDGFLCLPGSAVPYTFDVSRICSHRANAGAILHKSGNLLLVSTNSSLYTLSVEDAFRFLQACLKNREGGQWNSLAM